MKVLFVSSEAVPFAKSGGLGDVVGSLPRELKKQGVDARVVLPLYKCIKDKYGERLTYRTNFGVPLSWRNQYCGLFTMEYDGVTFYFLDNEQYFLRESLYGYFDDGERFAYYGKAVLESLRHMDFKPQILHCNDWQSAMTPVYLKTIYKWDPFFDEIRSVFTIHNVEYQGRFGYQIMTDIIGLPVQDYGVMEMEKDANFMKGAIVSCDSLTTVSPTYAEELTYPYYAYGLENIIRENAYKLRGIINGIDTDLYNPAKDPYLDASYSVRSPEKKRINKTALQAEFGLEQKEDVPLLAMVGRLVEHKGMALLLRVLDDLLAGNLQLIVLGTGDRHYEEIFRQKAAAYPGKMAVFTGFSQRIASRIYGGADLFLMPSISEPCGLSQLIALRYGTVPVVRETGGLRDTVHAFNPETGKGNGITFASVNAHDMLFAVRRAQEIYGQPELWQKLMKNAFRSDFTWKKSAGEYIDLYCQLTGETRPGAEPVAEKEPPAPLDAPVLEAENRLLDPAAEQKEEKALDLDESKAEADDPTSGRAEIQPFDQPVDAAAAGEIKGDDPSVQADAAVIEDGTETKEKPASKPADAKKTGSKREEKTRSNQTKGKKKTTKKKS